jgi:hypothetical protein
MIRASLRLVLDEDSSGGDRFEIGASIDASPDSCGAMLLWEHLVAELFKEAAENYFDQLPDPTTIQLPGRQSFTSQEIVAGTYFDRRNAYWCWFAIRQTLIEARWLLAQARAYKEIEPPRNSGDSATANRLLSQIHLDKMNRFDLAVYKLAKVEDLFLPLLFEGFGASLANVAGRNPNNEIHLTRDQIRKELKSHPSQFAKLSRGRRFRHWIKSVFRKKKPRSYLQNLPLDTYERILQVFNDWPNPHYVRNFTVYRNRLTHAFSPSVAFPEFYVELENRAGRSFEPATGSQRVVHEIGRTRTVAEFDFLEIYNDAVRTMEHYIRLLADLRAIPNLNLK